MLDVIMLSKGDDSKKRAMTQRAIKTLLNDYECRIIVVETITGINYFGCTVIHPNTKFNYNEFTKIGYKYVTAENVLFVNNDIICGKNCLKNLILALNDYPCVCPANPRLVEHNIMKEQYRVGFSIWQPAVFCGWAFMMKKTTIDEIGINKLFPTELAGWFSDNWVCEILKQNNLQSALVRDAHLEHLQSVTLKSLTKAEGNYYTEGQRENFDKLLESFE